MTPAQHVGRKSYSASSFLTLRNSPFPQQDFETPDPTRTRAQHRTTGLIMLSTVHGAVFMLVFTAYGCSCHFSEQISSHHATRAKESNGTNQFVQFTILHLEKTKRKYGVCMPCRVKGALSNSTGTVTKESGTGWTPCQTGWAMEGCKIKSLPRFTALYRCVVHECRGRR